MNGNTLKLLNVCGCSYELRLYAHDMYVTLTKFNDVSKKCHVVTVRAHLHETAVMGIQGGHS